MKLLRRKRSQPQPQAGANGTPPTAQPADGNNAPRRQPDPQAEPIPDGVHKYVPRSPYRTGNY